MLAFWIQFFHHIEHAILQTQAIIGHNLMGRPVPTSIVQLWVPRVELHLFYNTIVFIPMVIAMYYHLFPPAAEKTRPQCACAQHAAGWTPRRETRRGRRLCGARAVPLAAASPAAARDRAGPPLDVAWTLRPPSPVVGPATLTVTLRDQTGAPVKGAKVSLEGHMSHPGMAPVLADAVERTAGVYDVSFAFPMQGDWVLLVSATLRGRRTVERRIDVANVRPSG